MVPWFLVWFRLSLASIFPLAFFLGADGWIYVALLLAGIVSDIFDGVIARRWMCSTPTLRRADGNVDIIFYGSAGITVAILRAVYLAPWRWALAAMFFFMVTEIVVNIVKYGKQPSYHMWSAKLWGIVLVTALIGLFIGRPSEYALAGMVALGIYNSTEDIVATMALPQPMTDIPTVFHALKMAREGTAEPVPSAE